MLTHITRRPGERRAAWRWFQKRIALSVWTRQWFTFAVARDVYDGVPAIYVNYLDYDEAAHAFGPRSKQAFAGLRAVDRSLRQIRRAVRRVPGYRYDAFVLSDHGQAASTAYTALTGGRRFERVFFDEILPAAAGPSGAREPGEATEAAAYSRPPATRPVERALPARAPLEAGHDGGAGVELGFEPYLDVREAWEERGVRVVSAGPNAFVYFLDATEPVLLEWIEARWPGLAGVLSKSPGVGFVLARGAEGPVCFWRGQAHRLADADGGPFAGRADRGALVRDLTALMGMGSAGDLVVYGTDAPEGHVTYIDEAGSHAGPSPEELSAFLVAPSEVPVTDPLDHPLQLYDVFIRYRRDVAPAPALDSA
jgi:hypothetical protein